MKLEEYQALQCTFEQSGRTAYSSVSRGLFVRANDGKSFHEIRLDDYPISNRDQIFVPRFYINCDRADKRLPGKVAQKWGIEPDALYRVMALEITLLKEEFALLYSVLPAIIEHAEGGNSQGFADLLPFPFTTVTGFNIWSLKADSFANSARNATRRPT